MKQLQLFLGLLITGALVPNFATTDEKAFPKNLPSFACEIKPLTQAGLKMAKTNRQRFAKACLACVGEDCAMRIWPAGYEEQESLCRNTFCLPKKVKRIAFAEGYNMRYQYRYKISVDGQASLIDGNYLEGEPKGVTGKRTRETHLEMLNKFLTQAEYEPVIIDGQAKALINLSATLEIGADYQQ